jgi:hypothetical protein
MVQMFYLLLVGDTNYNCFLYRSYLHIVDVMTTPDVFETGDSFGELPSC